MVKSFIFFLLSLLPWIIQAQEKSDSTRIHAILSKGGQAARTGNYDSAQYYYTQAEKLSREASYKHGIMSSTWGHGLVLHYQRDIQKAVEYYLEALEMTKEGIDLTHPDVILLYNNLGGAYIDLGYRLKARGFLEQALEMKETSPEFSDISSAITRYNIGLIYMYFEENQSALHSFMAAYPAYLEHYGENGARVAQLYTNVGGIHRKLGNIEQAEEYFKRGIAIHLENHGADYWNLAYPYTNLGSLYVQTDRKEQGLQNYLSSLELCRKNRKELIRLEALNEGALAQYYLKEDDFDKSRHHANNAVRIMQDTYYDEHPRISEFYQIIGQTHVKQGNFELANQWFDQARELTIKGYGEMHPQISTLYLEQSKVYLENENFDHALESAQLALVTMSNTFNSNNPLENPRVPEVLNEKLMMNILTHKGNVFQGLAKNEEPQQNLAKALQQYQAAVLTIDHLRRGYLSESAKLFLQNNANNIYQQGLDVCYNLYKLTSKDEYLDDAFYFIEKSKSSVLSEALQASQVTSIQGVDAEVLEKEIELNQLAKSLELQLTDAQIAETDSVQNQLNKDLFRTKARVDSLEDIIRTRYPDYHQLKYNMEVMDLESLRDGISNQTLIMSFFEADSNWYVMSVSRDDTDLKKVSKSTLPEKTVDAFRLATSNSGSNPQEFYDSGHLIYQHLFQMPLEQNPGKAQLVVVPDGILNYLPFDALTITQASSDPSEALPKFMLEDYAISYRNSLTLYANSESMSGDYEQAYVGFAPSYEGQVAQAALREELSELEGARYEVESAGDLFDGLQFLDRTATEHQFKQLPSSSILHLAMHAQVDDEDPMRSRLIFTHASDSIEDGNLNAYEIYQLPIRAELAVLSACNTGLGKINKGEGVMSLSRAFMYAGCPNIVMSLWRAQDQPSTRIMNVFFKNLKDGMAKDEALRQAKLTYLKTADPFQAHPANWATFVLVGDNAPLSRPNNPLVWLGLGVLSVVLAGLYIKKRKRILLRSKV